jgi:septal ring factor EnvC (AmiA/AmiB activator)
LYCYFLKVLATEDGPEAEGENAKLKEAVAKHEEDLRVLAEHSAMMECEASDASKARDRTEAKLSKLSEEVEGLRAENARLREEHRIFLAENAKLQEDHFILKDNLGQL